MPLPETHPLSIEKKRRKKWETENKAARISPDQQRILSSPTWQAEWGRQQQLEKERLASVGYVQIITEIDDVCGAVLAFSDLENLGSKAARLLFYPAGWDMQLGISVSQQKEAQRQLKMQMEEKRRKKNNKNKSSKSIADEGAPTTNPLEPPPLLRRPDSTHPHYDTARRLLHLARIRYSVTLIPLPETVMSPLLLFNMTDYSRLLYLSQPAQVLRNMDNLLLSAPPAVIAAPRENSQSSVAAREVGDVSAQQGRTGGNGMSTNFLLITPSAAEFKYLKTHKGWNSMESKRLGGLLEELYSGTAMILPRWPYEIHTSEFFSSSTESDIDDRQKRQLSAFSLPVKKVLGEAYYLLFDGGKINQEKKWESVPQPWKTRSLQDDTAPQCTNLKSEDGEGRLDCTSRNVWRTAYDGYRQRRIEVCGLDLET
ncbi:hypothetical protein ABW20_dc0104258 [Dactylellina cionopaga]|nr:hypothetical protein ABW20_dc0104258 [Dactylellina cionopaga]